MMDKSNKQQAPEVEKATSDFCVTSPSSTSASSSKVHIIQALPLRISKL